jgi:protein-ribulosamine 3-kinase
LKSISEIIQYETGYKPQVLKRLNGGDINQVYHCITKKNQFVVKVNYSEKYPKMFEKEKKGLELLNKSSFIIPNVFSSGSLKQIDYLILEYIKPSKSINWKIFGENLASLHQITSQEFGLDYDNYIGSIEQINSCDKNWFDFYANKRLILLMKLARNKNLLTNKDCNEIERICNSLKDIIPNSIPSLIHGDLWPGNIIGTENGVPVLIDPAVYYGHPEMDWAMLDLFGNFPKISFDTYNEINPLEIGFQNRKYIFQLYPLLVHLVLFGSGYYSAVIRIVKKYS